MMKKKRAFPAKVRRLQFHGPDGQPRQRLEAVENEIKGMLPLPHSERAARAPACRSETLVYFIKRPDDSDNRYLDVFAGEIDKRVVDQADRYVFGLPPVKAEDIVRRVQWDFRLLLVAERPSAKTEFLEIRFALAVKTRTLQLMSLYRSSPWSRQVDIDAPDSEGEWQQETGPGPEDVLLELESKERCGTAIAAITDPVDREAATLHWLEGWPIASQKGKRDLVTHFGTTRRRIERRLERAMKQMRAALGVEVTK
jgi:hypothetical protein